MRAETPLFFSPAWKILQKLFKINPDKFLKSNDNFRCKRYFLKSLKDLPFFYFSDTNMGSLLWVVGICPSRFRVLI